MTFNIEVTEVSSSTGGPPAATPGQPEPTPPIKGELSRQPVTHNIQSSLGFRMFLRRSPDVNYFNQTFTVPAVALPAASMATPFLELPKPGDHMIFNPLIFTFMCEEGLKNYFTLVEWMKTLSLVKSNHPGEKYEHLAEQPEWTQLGLKSDILVSIEDAAKNSIGVLTFYDGWPTSLSELSFDVTQPTVKYLKATASFRFSYYDWKPGA